MDNYLLIDRSEVAKNWHARGFSCGLWIDHAGREWSYDAQETEELFMIMSGELELEIEGRSQKPAIGQEISIPAGVPYIIRNIGGKTSWWLYGQPRKTETESKNPDTSQKRSFHPELKRKRRLEKRIIAFEGSKEV